MLSQSKIIKLKENFIISKVQIPYNKLISNAQYIVDPTIELNFPYSILKLSKVFKYAPRINDSPPFWFEFENTLPGAEILQYYVNLDNLKVLFEQEDCLNDKILNYWTLHIQTEISRIKFKLNRFVFIFLGAIDIGIIDIFLNNLLEPNQYINSGLN